MWPAAQTLSTLGAGFVIRPRQYPSTIAARHCIEAARAVLNRIILNELLKPRCTETLLMINDGNSPLRDARFDPSCSVRRLVARRPRLTLEGRSHRRLAQNPTVAVRILEHGVAPPRLLLDRREFESLRGQLSMIMIDVG
jgi:hypothetical protein